MDKNVTPMYEPLWSFEKIEKAIVGANGFGVPFCLNYSQVYNLMMNMRSDYDQALSLAQFNLWKYQGAKE